MCREKHRIKKQKQNKNKKQTKKTWRILSGKLRVSQLIKPSLMLRNGLLKCLQSIWAQ